MGRVRKIDLRERAGARGRRPTRARDTGRLGVQTAGRIGIGRRGTIIPSLDPIRRGDSPTRFGLPPRPRPRPRPIPQIGTDFGVLQPLGRPRPRPRPTRVTVASPSGRRGKLITVSSRSRLARLARQESVRRPDRRPDVFRTGARGKKVKVKQKRPIRVLSSVVPRPPRPPVFDFMPFQEITFREGRREGRRFGEEEERPRRRFQPSPRRRREQTASDFDLGNIFDIQF